MKIVCICCGKEFNWNPPAERSNVCPECRDDDEEETEDEKPN